MAARVSTREEALKQEKLRSFMHSKHGREYHVLRSSLRQDSVEVRACSVLELLVMLSLACTVKPIFPEEWVQRTPSSFDPCLLNHA